MAAHGARRDSSGTRFDDVRTYAEVGSTNEVVARLAADGALEGVVVVADHQTAGRGRWGRTWEAPPGSSLLASVLLRPGPDAVPPTPVTVAAGLAAADACLDAAGFRPGLKWPNDLVVDGRKLGGMLADVVNGGEGSVAVVLGLGVNLVGPVLAPGGIAAAEAAGGAVDRDTLLFAFLDRLERWYGLLATAAGRGQAVEEYRRRCVTLGHDVRVVRPGGAVLEGRAVDVTPTGSLVVGLVGDETVVVDTGDVDHVRPR